MAGRFCSSGISLKLYGCMAHDAFRFPTKEGYTFQMPEEKRSDHELIEATKNGDESAFTEIVSRYKSPITNYLYRFLNDYEEAVDIAQETFVRVYFAIDRYHTQFAFSTYIYRIATNLAISEIRRRKRRRLFSISGILTGDKEEPTEFEIPDERRLPEDELLENERDKQVARAIAALPEKYRIPIILRDVEGRTYEEVSAVMDLGLGTTKSRISRGRALLKEKLQEYLQ